MQRIWQLVLVILLLSATLTATQAAELDNIEQYATGWALNFDNDLLVGGDRDQDYTGGVSLAFSGSRVKSNPLSVDKLRDSLNRLTGFNRVFDNEHHFNLHSMDAGFALFTPSDISQAAPQLDDHPYASLFFVSNSEQVIVPAKRVSYQSVFTVGLLGLPLAEDIQSALHESTGSDEPMGWDNQISAGGEPTARYTFGVRKAVVQAINSNRLGYEVNLMSDANIGFTTDVNAGFNVRWGRLATPWWSFSPHQAEYVNLGSSTSSSPNFLRVREMFVYAGGAVKYRLYNALLQGQFRRSEVSFSRSELEAVIGEVWAGVNIELPSRLRLGLFARARTPEFDKVDARAPVWGGLTISRAF